MTKDIATSKPLKVLLLLHGLVTLAAGLVLIFLPPAIPRMVNIAISHNEYLLCYLLGAAELGIAFLSLFSRQLKDKASLRLISASFIIFHIASGGLEAIAFANGASQAILFNILLRLFISFLFWYYGLYHLMAKKQNNRH